MKRTLLQWAALLVAAVCLTIAALLAGIVPASECSTVQEMHATASLPFFLVYAAAGLWLAATGTVVQRILLFLGTAFVMTAYITMLADSLPMVLQTEVSCAAQRGQQAPRP